MLELYEWPPTRSQRVKWLLEELEINYTSQKVDLTKSEQHSAIYRALHPLGAVPAIKTDNYIMFESVAIILQLADEHLNKTLAPAPGSADRASYYQWCVFAGSELDPAIMLYFDNTQRPLEHMRPSGTQHNSAMAEKGQYEFRERAKVLTAHLKDRDYILGAEFSAADILIGHSIFMAKHIGLLEDSSVLEAYHSRLSKRPAYKRAYGN